MARDTSKPSILSEEFVQESSDEDSTPPAVQPNGQNHDRSSKITTKPKANKKPAESSSSSSEEDDESEAESSTPPPAQKRTREDDADRRKPPSKKQRPSAMRIPAKAFRPPPGYEVRLFSLADTDVSVMQALRELKGKQVWHITAPATVDLSQINELDVAAALRNEPIHTAHGVSYGLQPSTDQPEVLLLPKGSPVTYKQAGTKITRSFQLRQVNESKPRETNGTESTNGNIHGIKFTAQKPGQKRAARQQPAQLLNYRYVPFGVTKSDGDNELRLAESILLKAASQGDAMEGVEREVVNHSKKKDEKKKKKKSKLVDEPSI